MAYDLTKFGQKTDQIREHLREELASIRTGRATPAILDAIFVDAYGSKMTIREIASITVEDPKTIRVIPWDGNLLKPIEKTIVESDLGLSVSLDDKGLRVSFPELTTERRESLVKVLKHKHEEARVSLRHEREEIKKDIEKKEKEGSIGEDDKFRYLDELQEKIDEVNNKFDEMTDKKESEIRA